MIRVTVAKIFACCVLVSFIGLINILCSCNAAGQVKFDWKYLQYLYFGHVMDVSSSFQRKPRFYAFTNHGVTNTLLKFKLSLFIFVLAFCGFHQIQLYKEDKCVLVLGGCTCRSACYGGVGLNVVMTPGTNLLETETESLIKLEQICLDAVIHHQMEPNHHKLYGLVL